MALHGWILLAEDDEIEAQQVTKLLEQAGVGGKIVIARTGSEALSCLRLEGRFTKRPRGDPRFVLVKQRLPVYDGVSVLRTIKEDLKMMHVPVIIYARSISQQHLEAAYVWGVNGYIVKPRNPVQLARVITSVGQFWGISNIHPGGCEGVRDG